MWDTTWISTKDETVLLPILFFYDHLLVSGNSHPTKRYTDTPYATWVWRWFSYIALVPIVLSDAATNVTLADIACKILSFAFNLQHYFSATQKILANSDDYVHATVFLEVAKRFLARTNFFYATCDQKPSLQFSF